MKRCKRRANTRRPKPSRSTMRCGPALKARCLRGYGPLTYAAHVIWGWRKLVLIRYYFDYERARIWRSGALETSRHDRSVQRPCQGFGGATWAGSVLRRVAPDQTEVHANSYAVERSCRRPERAPRVASSGCDPYRSSHPCAPEAPEHGA